MPEEERIGNDGVLLSFSSDSVIFDTLFAEIPSITRRLRVTNPDDKAVIIDQIRLAEGVDSPFRLYLNGQQGHRFEDEFLLGGDSLLILAEVDVMASGQDTPFVVDDDIIFYNNGTEQRVKLVAWGQEAYFISKKVISEDTVWTAARPIILMDSVLIDSAVTLTIEAGSRIFADPNGTLLIGGKLNVSGTIDDPVVFTNSRLDLRDAFGQWNGLFFLRTSRDNAIVNTRISNAVNGIYLGTPDQDTIPDLVLYNVEIKNMLGNGILAFTSDIYGENLLIHNCVRGNIALFAGGYYYFTQCTWANYSTGYFREAPVAAFLNHLEGGLVNDFRLDLYNSILYGDQMDEIIFSFVDGSEVVISLAHNLLKSSANELDVNNNILNMDPAFLNPLRQNFHLDTLSPAQNAGSELLGNDIDLDGKVRQGLPDMGAFERIE